MLDGIDIKIELDNENELKLQLEEIKSKINSLKKEEKYIKEQLLEIKKQKDIENGFDKTLVDFYNKKIPNNNKDDYMS